MSSGTVTLERNGKVYTARYDVLKSGVVRLETGQATQRGGLTDEQIARLLLSEVIESGQADREGLGRPPAW